MLTWNIGSWQNHATAILSVIAKADVHLAFLQECSINDSRLAAIRSEARMLGFTVLPSVSNGMVTLAKHGVNIAPIKTIAKDDYRMQYLALQLAEARVLVRHRHAPADRPIYRQALNQILSDSPSGDLFIDIGDFNEHPSVSPGAQVVFPDSNTFRRHTDSNDYITKIDCAVISNLASAGSSATTLPTRAKTQHRPVLLPLDIPARVHEFYCVVTPPPDNMGAWAHETIAAFNDVMQTGTIERAWDIWIAAAGASTPRVQRCGFSCGESAQRVHTLFKRRDNS